MNISTGALLLAGLLLATSATATINENIEAQSIFSRIEGKWDLINNPKLCAAGTDIHIIKFNSDRTIAYFERPNPPKDDDGKDVHSYSYRVIYSGGKSITMHLVGEKRKLETGDDYIWVIEEREPDVYSWRLYGFYLRSPEPATFRKCP